MALQDPPPKDIFDAALATFVGVCEAVPMLGALGIKAAGSALNGIEGATGALVQATNTPAGYSTESASHDFAALIQGCGSLNLGLKNPQAETGCDINPERTGQLSAAAFFGAGCQSGQSGYGMSA